MAATLFADTRGRGRHHPAARTLRRWRPATRCKHLRSNWSRVCVRFGVVGVGPTPWVLMERPLTTLEQYLAAVVPASLQLPLVEHMMRGILSALACIHGRRGLGRRFGAAAPSNIWVVSNKDHPMRLDFKVLGLGQACKCDTRCTCAVSSLKLPSRMRRWWP